MAKPTLQDSSLLAAALEGLELQKARIEDQIKTVRAMLGARAPRATAAAPATTSVVAATAPAAAPKKRRKGRRNQLSPEARARIAEAQRKRWAAFRKANKGE